jgi:hypothetical protein
VKKTLGGFADAAPLLTVFSRRIRTITLRTDEQSTTWTSVEVQLTESGRLSYAMVGNRTFFCFRCPISSDDRPATVLFNYDGVGISPLSVPLTGLWITTPTAERSELRFALNAPFKPDAGRLRLAVSNYENRRIAEEVAQAWGESLIELFDHTIDTWDELSKRLRLHKDATPQSFWMQIWCELSRSSPVVDWKAIQNGGQVLAWITWGRSNGAMRRLIHERAAIPTDLRGTYCTLARVDDLRFSVSGLLAEFGNGAFAHVAQWSSTKKAFRPGSVVSPSVAAHLAAADIKVELGEMTLQQVLFAAINGSLRVDPVEADRLGSLLIECKSLFEPSGMYAVEVQRLQAWMRTLSLRASDKVFHPANELVCGRAVSDVIDRDEALRAAFAPSSAVLSADYSGAALTFFVKARGRLAAEAAVLAEWARDADEDKLIFVFNYLVTGALGQELADELQRSWLDIKRSSRAWQALSVNDRSEVERKFARGQLWFGPHSVPEPLPDPVVQPVICPEDALSHISEWWRQEHRSLISEYEVKTYPTGFPGTLPWPGSDEWDSDVRPNAQARWLLLFIQAALVPLGLNMIGRDRGFSQFLTSNGWLDVLVNVADAPDDLIAALDDYLDAYVQTTEYHFQMRQFVPFYAVAKNLESLLLSLRETERSESPASFRLAFSPRANPVLTGTGIDAPPVVGMLGIGTCQLLRELYRLGRLTNPTGHRFAFTPIRKVRRLCDQLFGVGEGLSPFESSEAIFLRLNELGSQIGIDCTFNNCFDLPLQYLAEDRMLRTQVLDVDFDLAVEEDLDSGA